MGETSGFRNWLQREPAPWLVVSFSVIVMAVLVAFTGTSIKTGLDSRRESSPIDGGIRTTGTVVDVEPDGDTTFKARIEFVDRAGSTRRFTKQAGSDKPRVGEAVEISYDPDDPSEARDLTTNKDIWKYQLLPGVVLLPVAVVGGGAGLVMYLRKRRVEGEQG